MTHFNVHTVFCLCCPFSLTHSSTRCHRFPLFRLLVLCIHFLQPRAFVLPGHSDTTSSPTQALPQRSIALPVSHPRSNSRHSSSSSDPLYTRSILTLATVRSRFAASCPITNTQMEPLGDLHAMTHHSFQGANASGASRVWMVLLLIAPLCGPVINFDGDTVWRGW